MMTCSAGIFSEGENSISCDSARAVSNYQEESKSQAPTLASFREVENGSSLGESPQVSDEALLAALKLRRGLWAPAAGALTPGVLNRLFELQACFDLSGHTLSLAVSMLRQVAGLRPLARLDKALACLLVATKFEEPVYKAPKLLASFRTLRVRKSTVLELEASVVFEFDFRLLRASPISVFEVSKSSMGLDELQGSLASLLIYLALYDSRTQRFSEHTVVRSAVSLAFEILDLTETKPNKPNFELLEPASTNDVQECIEILRFQLSQMSKPEFSSLRKIFRLD